MKITKAIEDLETIRKMHGDDIELVGIRSGNSSFTESFIGFQCPTTDSSFSAGFCLPFDYENRHVVEFKYN